jgi:TPR repeat protein
LSIPEVLGLNAMSRIIVSILLLLPFMSGGTPSMSRMNEGGGNIGISLSVDEKAVAQETRDRLYILQDASAVRFQVPLSWKSRVRGQLSGHPPMIEFAGVTNDSFQVMVSLIGIPLEHASLLSPAQLWMELGKVVDAVKSNSVERLIEIKEVKGKAGSGYFFSATARTPDPSGHKFLTQGLVRLGDAVLTFVVLSRENEKEAVSRVLAMIQTASYLHRSEVLAQNDAQSNRHMAYTYEMGTEGVRRDLDTALQYYLIGSEQGDAESEYRLAMIHWQFNSPYNDKQIFRLCTSAAKKGHAEAQAFLGNMYGMGLRGVEVDIAQSVKWIQAAAAKGVPLAMRLLGRYYIDGTGVRQDPVEALKWLEKAAKTGDRASMVEIGCTYMNGKGVPRNREDGVYWFYKAALAGDRQSMGLLEEMSVISDKPENDYQARQVRTRLLAEEGLDVLAINIGNSSNKVLSVLGTPEHISRFGVTYSNRTDTLWTDVWHYREGRVDVKDGKVVQSEITRMTEQGKKKLAASGKLHDLQAPPFITPTSKKYWPLAASALVMELNGRRHDLLGGQMPTPENVRSELWNLYCWWGVISRDSLLEQLDWLEKEGHRKGFEEIARMADSMTDAERDKLMSDNSKVAYVVNNKKELGAKSLISWDYSRYILLCRWGYLAGYLTEDEAWAKIMPAARLLQKTFISWEDLGKNYLAGREYWSESETEKSGNNIREAFETLRTNKISPWKLCSWSVDLGETASGPKTGSTGTVPGVMIRSGDPARH